MEEKGRVEATENACRLVYPHLGDTRGSQSHNFQIPSMNTCDGSMKDENAFNS